MKICILASGSAGNATFVATESTRVLIDCGISKPEIATRLRAIGEEPSMLDAILITHEHTDHVAGLRGVVRGYRLPVYIPRRCSTYLPSLDGTIPDFRFVDANKPFHIGDLAIWPHPVEHDAVSPVAYQVSHDRFIGSIITDLGEVSDQLRYALDGNTFLLIEANHDQPQLWNGIYPDALKERVSHNHLSNAQAFDLLRDIHVDAPILGHISDNNNNLSRLAELNDRYGLNAVIAKPGQQSQVFTF